MTSNIKKVSLKRYMRDLKDLIIESESDENNVIYKVIPGKDCSLLVIINGPVGTLYENGKFCFEISIDNKSDYPFTPPKVKLNTKIFHPNVDNDGNICLDLIGKNWTPTLNFRTLVLSLSSFLEDPNPDDPLNIDASKLYIENKDEYDKKVKEYNENYALSSNIEELNKT